MLNILIFLTNISSILIELFSELLIDDHKTQMLYEAWHGVSYAISRYLIIIEFEDYLHIKGDKKVDSKKLIAKLRKMTIIKY